MQSKNPTHFLTPKLVITAVMLPMRFIEIYFLYFGPALSTAFLSSSAIRSAMVTLRSRNGKATFDLQKGSTFCLT